MMKSTESLIASRGRLPTDFLTALLLEIGGKCQTSFRIALVLICFNFLWHSFIHSTQYHSLPL